MTDKRFRPSKTMILAAGLGKRMRPLTATTPKPLIEVNGQALIDHGMDRLAAAGVKTCVVNVHYLADLVEVHVRRRADMEILVSDEREQLLETGAVSRRRCRYWGKSRSSSSMPIPATGSRASNPTWNT